MTAARVIVRDWPPYMRAETLAEYLDLPPASDACAQIRKRVAAGELPGAAYNEGREPMWTRAQVDEWIAEHRLGIKNGRRGTLGGKIHGGRRG